MQSKGADSAVAQYRRLRMNVMVAGGYDFGEWSINETARHWAGQDKTGEAITLLKLNQEFYPNSSSIDLMIAELHLRRSENDDAIVRFRAVLRREPNNPQALRRLKELGAMP
jgi:predicted Zn-dependent protease